MSEHSTEDGTGEWADRPRDALRRRLAVACTVVACFAAAVAAFQAAADVGRGAGAITFEAAAGGADRPPGGDDSVVAIGPESSGPPAVSPPSASGTIDQPSPGQPVVPGQSTAPLPQGSAAPPGHTTGAAPGPHTTAGPTSHTTAKPAPHTMTTKPPPASHQVSGTVTCLSGESVEGVWVQANQGSGFAPWQGIGNGSTSSYWYTLPVYENYSLHVGCGGLTSDWGVSLTTQEVGGTHNSFVCHDVDGDSDYGRCFVG